MTDKKTPIRLGVMAPLSGLVGLYGTEISNAASIAAAEVNEQGGIRGRPLELVIVDDGSLPETAVPAAERLIKDQACVAIIGNLLSNSRIDVAYKVAEPLKTPYLNFSFYEGSISSRYFFHFAALPNQQIDHMIPYMADRFGPKFFFAGSNYEWPRGSIDAAKRSLSRCDGEVVGEQYIPIGADIEKIDLLLDAVARSGADVFVPYFAGADQINLLTRFTEMGLKQRMAVVMGHYDEAMVSRLPPEVREGFYSSNTYFMGVKNRENRRYLKRLAALDGINGIWPNGNGVLTNFGEGTYLCVKAFAQAANLAGSVNAEALVTALETITVEGPQGQVVMDPHTHHATVNSYLAQCRADGTFSIVTGFDPLPPEIPARYRMAPPPANLPATERKNSLTRFSQAIANLDLDGTIRDTNSSFQRLWPDIGVALIGRPFSSLWHEAERVEKILGSMVRLGEWSGELSAKTGEHARSLELSIEGALDGRGKLRGFTVLCLDPQATQSTPWPTAQHHANNILSIIDIGVVAIDASGTIIQANANAARMFGYDEDEMAGMLVHLLLPPHFREHHVLAISQFIQSTDNEVPMGSRGEIAGYRKDGSEFPAEASISKFHGPNGWVLVATLRDITEYKVSREKLRWEATHDPLTRLPNRTLFRERLDNALQRSRRHAHGLAVLFIDLDGFKLINDSFGHDTGDHLLTLMSERICDAVRPGDTVGRFGGDEFVVLCEQLEEATVAARVADRINETLRRPITIKGHEFFATASIGLAYGHGDNHDSEALLRNADAAMYSAKDQGRDSWRLFNESHHEQAKSQLTIANGLRSALERNEFEVVMQPIVSAVDSRIVGAEALLRWHLRGETISPAEFIPIAEMSGMIIEIGQWVFRRACEVQHQWQHKFGLAAPYISINLSTRQLSDSTLAHTFAQILKETGAQPERIILE
ncbi:MAG: ABC transporter substrate-binding protein, partial [Chromatiales bacterium]|nr:ABC transporter substrate-binding protein [Chromatiales bacterium]